MGARAEVHPGFRFVFEGEEDCWIRESSYLSHLLSWIGAIPLALARALRDGLDLEGSTWSLLTIDPRLIFC